MTNLKLWPCKAAASFAVFVGVFLLLGGGGHLSAVLDSRAGQPFDYRFVSLITTSGILLFPGVVSIGTSYWLWQGKSWAYVSCLLSASALMLYLCLLVYMKSQAPASATSTGAEVYSFAVLVFVYLVVLLSVFAWLLRSRGDIGREVHS